MTNLRISKEHGLNPSMDCCLYCGEVKQILLLGQLRNDEKAQTKAVYSTEPCDNCKTIMGTGYTVLEVDNKKQQTGRFVVLTMEAAKRIGFPESEHNKAFCYENDFSNMFSDVVSTQ